MAEPKIRVEFTSDGRVSSDVWTDCHPPRYADSVSVHFENAQGEDEPWSCLCCGAVISWHRGVQVFSVLVNRLEKLSTRRGEG